MDCYNGCGAPLVDGVCLYCGREYSEAKPAIIHGIIDVEDLDDLEDALEEVEEIVAMGTSFGPSYEPGLMEYDDYPRSFEDAQKTLGMFTVTALGLGVFFAFIGLLPLGLVTVVFGLGCALAGGIRQYKHNKEETHDI